VYENNPTSENFVEDFQNAGGKIYKAKLKNIYDLKYYRKVYDIIIKNNIDIVHTYFTPTCHYLNIYLTFKGFKNLVRTAANLPISFKKNKKRYSLFTYIYYSIRHRFLSKFVKKIICRSEGVRDEYLRLGISLKKLAAAFGGVDTERYKFSCEARKKIRKSYNIKEDTILIGVFCRLVAVKGIDRLLEFFCELSLHYKEMKLFVAGDGQELENLKKLSNSLKLSDSIHFLGQIEDVSKLYSALDIFCLPSLAEGMSNSLLEAMACELPIIATDIDPNRELVTEGRGGFLISFRNKEEFKDRIENLLDKKIREDMGKYNRLKVASHFSVISRVEKEFKIYNQLLT